MLKLRFLALVPALALFASAGWTDEPEVPAKGDKQYATGRVAPPDLQERKVRAAERNAGYQFPRTSARKFDCRDLGIVPPVVNQANCGSCWDFAGSGCCTMAAIKAGYGPADGSFRLSEQYVLDCVRSGGCNGDDHSTVFDHALHHGLPTHKEYGPYMARVSHCKSVKDFIKIKGWGYCEPNARGPASTQAIKDCMAAKGPISVAIAADRAFMNVQPGKVFKGSGSRNINHEVLLIAWDDDKGAWCLRNSWGPEWGDEGNIWIAYGANEVGTDAAWAEVESVIPPPPPHPPKPPKDPFIPQWVLQLLIAILSALAGVGTGKLHERHFARRTRGAGDAPGPLFRGPHSGL